LEEKQENKSLGKSRGGGKARIGKGRLQAPHRKLEGNQGEKKCSEGGVSRFVGLGETQGDSQKSSSSSK